MLPDLERNGDLAEHVARRAARGLEPSCRPEPGLIERMGEVAIHMWRSTTDAYAERLPTAAALVDDLDDEMDDLHVSLTMEVVAGTMPLPVAVELAWSPGSTSASATTPSTWRGGWPCCARYRLSPAGSVVDRGGRTRPALWGSGTERSGHDAQ